MFQLAAATASLQSPRKTSQSEELDTVVKDDPHNVRCECGKLLARRTNQGVELKCPRCKSLWCVPIDWGGQQSLELIPLKGSNT
jgi:hypothetical protein